MSHIATIAAGTLSLRIRAGLCALLLAASVAAALPARAAGQSYTPLAVVELFTSQGCSSSPAADALLTEMAREGDIIALSLPVTYWDYLGWSDTRASQANTSRQFSYAARRDDRAVFTPQLIVNGRTPVVGSDAEAVRAAIAEQSGSGLAPSVPVDIRHSGRLFKVDVGAGTGSRTGACGGGCARAASIAGRSGRSARGRRRCRRAG